MDAKLLPCPFCGAEVIKNVGLAGVSFYYCTNDDCSAVVSFLGKNKLAQMIGEDVEPDNYFNKRLIVTIDESKLQ